MSALVIALGISILGCWFVAALVLAWVGAACAEDDSHVDRDAIGDYPRERRAELFGVEVSKPAADEPDRDPF